MTTDSVTTPPSTEPRQRYSGIESLRLVAAMGIVWFHVNAPYASIGYGGLSLFMAISIALAWNTKPGMSTASIISRRAKRLLVPWIIWSIVFAIAKTAQSILEQQPIASEFDWHMLLTGTSIHLWFLPFSFLVGLPVSMAASRGLLHRNAQQVIAWSGTSIALGFAAAWLLSTGFDTVPFVQWTYITPSVALGMAIAALPSAVPHRGWLAFIALAAIAASLGPTLLDWNSLAPSFTAGGIALVVAFGIRRPASNLTIWFGSLAYGVYLIHPLVRAAIDWSLGFDNPTTLGLATIVISVGVTAIMRVSPLRAVM